MSIMGNVYDQLDEANAQLAALREEMVTAKRNEHNSEVAYKSAIERQEELRTELAELEEEFDTLEHSNVTLKLSLADAERRNYGAYDKVLTALRDETEIKDIKRIATLICSALESKS